MKRQTAARTKRETTTLPVRGPAGHSAVRADPGHERAPNVPLGTRFGHDFSHAAVRPSAPMVGQKYGTAACPVFPRTCPFGGACHVCPPQVQTKLKIGQRGDRFEREADRVAEQVTRTSERQTAGRAAHIPQPSINAEGISRTSPGSGAQHSERQNTQNQHDRPCSFRASITVNEIARKARTRGRPLDLATRNFMGSQFGTDFGGVQVHTHENAQRACKAFGANAFTIGRHIFFDQGQYAPHSEEGKKLIAHELAHVVQQQSNEQLSIHQPAEISRLENEAEQFSQQVSLSHQTQAHSAEQRPFNRQHVSLSTTHPGVLLGRRPGESYRDCINRQLGEMGLEIDIGWIAIGACGVVATIAGAAGAEAGVIPPAVFAAALCMSFATGVEVGILASILWDCR
jgi:hypothetical protein